MIAVLDLGIGNLSSVQSGLLRAGSDSIVISDGAAWDELLTNHSDVQGVILPGVGAFGDAMFQLRSSGLLQVVRQVAKEGRPLFGICLGMQLLFSLSEEHGSHMGLGLLPGKIVRFQVDAKVPHMGWNDLTYVQSHPLLHEIVPRDYVYFVHSYYAELKEESHLLAASEYAGTKVPAVVGREMVFGTQFHPEKSGQVGDKILRNFVTICNEWQQRREVVTV
jgi:imidazole glycerol-phosphate synthase subunit HisH